MTEFEKAMYSFAVVCFFVALYLMAFEMKIH